MNEIFDYILLADLICNLQNKQVFKVIEIKLKMHHIIFSLRMIFNLNS